MISVILVSLFLLVEPEISAQESYAGSAEFRIAHGYVQQAEVLYREGRYHYAARLLDAALEFLPGYSEAALLYAKIDLRTQDTTWKAIEHLETAVRSNTWVHTEPAAGAVELARLYVRTFRFQEARQIILKLEDTAPAGRGSSELSILWAQTLIGLGDLGAAQTFLSEALRQFPQSPQLYKLLAEVLNRRGSRQSARDVLQRGIKEMPEEAELIYQLAALQGSADGRRELVERYIQVGGSDPAAALLAVGGGSRRRYLDLFFRMGGNGRIDHLDQLRRMLPEEEFRELIDGYSGSRISDANRDGFYEQRYEYEGGVLKRWISDQDQNGIPEATVDFERGIPRVVNLSSGGDLQDLQYRYSDYPFLHSATVFSGPLRQEYRMIPYTVRHPVFVASEQLQLQLRSGVIAGQDYIRRNSYGMEEYSGDDPIPDRRIHLLDGRITRVDELPDARGNFTRTIYYAGSLPVKGFRDMDGDGSPEIREQFLNGRLWKITMDQDGDGNNEFEQVFESDSYRMYWDYDNDGVYDSREFSRSDGTLVRGFSSRLNGIYDLSDSGGSR
ncbi:MAG: tetratricopeptide repeat protein [Spirochaetaceae bacterium]|nr:MAG: tetratricopeptide repeat protein [Spirochaetaceae bacterium]